MTNANFNVFGMGSDQLNYIGWTRRALTEEREILTDLAKSSSHQVAHWAEQACHCGTTCIFEIESAPSVEDARDTVQFWCQYYGMLGAKVVTD